MSGGDVRGSIVRGPAPLPDGRARVVPMEARFALSLTQPWASAMALGLKRIETRSWSTALRGPIAIHASKGFPLAAKAFALCEAYPYIKHEPEWFPRGAIVAVGVLSDVVPTEILLPHLMPQEEFWGNYEPGRFGWVFDRILPLLAPVPATGRLGIWTMPADVQAAVREALP